MQSAKFITLEGVECAGKSTQTLLMRDYLKDKYNIEAIITREPGGSPDSEQIRDLLSSKKWDSWSELLLLMAGRRQHIISTILPALNAGTWVICDRFFDSSIVYQGLNIAPEKIKWLYNNISNDLIPDITIVIDIETKNITTRLKQRSGVKHHYYDEMDHGFHQKIKDGFLSLAKAEPQRIKVVNGNDSIENTFSQISELLDESIN